MNVYKLSQTVQDHFETYDSCVVIAENPESAKKIHPNGYYVWTEAGWEHKGYLVVPMCDAWNSWPPDLNDITVEYIGMFDGDVEKFEDSVICASYNAG